MQRYNTADICYVDTNAIGGLSVFLTDLDADHILPLADFTERQAGEAHDKCRQIRSILSTWLEV